MSHVVVSVVLYPRFALPLFTYFDINQDARPCYFMFLWSMLVHAVPTVPYIPMSDSSFSSVAGLRLGSPAATRTSSNGEVNVVAVLFFTSLYEEDA